jgi:cold shock CspA family protein
MLPPVQVTFRNIEDRAGLDDYVQKEVATLERFYSRISSCRVVVERPQRATSSKLFHVRIDLGVPNEELVVKHIPSLHGTLEDMQTQKSRREAKSVLVHKNPKRAIHEAFQEMGRQLQDYARRQNGAVKAKQRMQQAIVKEILPEEGYGFLETDGHFLRLSIGTRVKFTEESGEKGPQASTVKVSHQRKQARSAAAVSVLPAKSARK